MVPTRLSSNIWTVLMDSSMSGGGMLRYVLYPLPVTHSFSLIWCRIGVNWVGAQSCGSVVLADGEDSLVWGYGIST